MALWIRVHGAKPSAWVERARARGIMFRAGLEFSLEGKPLPYVRMGFTRLNEKEISKAVREAARAWDE
jgi:GntR family transcriptional regulator/MocR family aminotransferase